MRKISLFIAVFLLGSLVFPNTSWGVMSSTNYTIFADSINSGGILSTSGTFYLQDTIGEPAIGVSTSSVYQVVAGYQAMAVGSLSISVNPASIDLGTLSTDQVSSSSVVVSVTSSASDGYTLSVASVSGSSLTAVSDGSVTAGAEEYGVAVSGASALFGDDRAVAANLNLASSAGFVESSQTTLTFKASISAGSTSGSRSQSITLVASANI